MRYAITLLLVTAAAACDPKPKEPKGPQKTPHEIAKDDVTALALAYGVAYRKTERCVELQLWPDEFKSCSKGCMPQTWEGAWSDIDWKPEGKSFAHFMIRDVDEANHEGAKTCAYKAVAFLDMNDDKSFKRIEVYAGAFAGKDAGPTTILSTTMLGHD